MSVTFIHSHIVSSKVERRAEDIAVLRYRFFSDGLNDGKFLLRCIRQLDDNVVATVVCDAGELSSAIETIINKAYEILYGEENDQES